MSRILRTLSALGQNFFACLPAIALCGAWKARGGGGGGASVKEGKGRQPRYLVTNWYQGEGPEIIPWGSGEGHRESHFAQRNCLFSL